jgi:hypothetical protein
MAQSPFMLRKKTTAKLCRGEGSVVLGLQLRVRFAPAALLAMLRTALALQCVSKARDWTGHVDRWLVLSQLLACGPSAADDPEVQNLVCSSRPEWTP